MAKDGRMVGKSMTECWVLYGGLTIIIVVADYQLFKFTKLAQLAPNILVESIKVVLQLRRIHAVLVVVSWVLVQVGHEDRLRV